MLAHFPPRPKELATDRPFLEHARMAFRSGPPTLLVVLVVAVFLWSLVFYHLISSTDKNASASSSYLTEFTELEERLRRLERAVGTEQEQLRAVRTELEKSRNVEKALLAKHGVGPSYPPLTGAWPEPIPVLVFVCNRVHALRSHLQKLLQYRPSAERFPIVVSQDCDNQQVADAVKEFGDQVTYIKHISGARANIVVPPQHRQWTTYYRIARHYKLALEHVIDKLKYTSVIITEDDLDIAPDFFEYFSATRKLLQADQTLWCVSSWNDNGKAQLIDMEDSGRLYRSDFFSGLGWMMTSELWSELRPIWPAGFWDDWLRDPARRQNRTCIRPEISRTAMTIDGKTGASKGQFFNKHLIKVQVNTIPVNFTTVDLGYLMKNRYDDEFHRLVYEESTLMSVEDTQKILLRAPPENADNHAVRPIRVEYNGNMDYIRKADVLRVMHDFKAGVPRTAYLGVVSCFINKRRVFLAPDPQAIHGYDPQWHVPDGFPE